MKPMIAVDFDGTVAMYGEWKGDAIVGDAIPGSIEFLRALAQKFTVVIFSARASTERGKKAIFEWVRRYNLRQIVYDVTNEKKYSFVHYIDDKAITFNEPSDYPKIAEALGCQIVIADLLTVNQTPLKNPTIV